MQSRGPEQAVTHDVTERRARQPISRR
jgi:hypothetical protein